MNSRTIFSAYIDARLKFKNTRRPDKERVRGLHQADKFERETMRRLDERDALTERNAFLLASAEAAQANLAACRRELAEARAYISTIIEAPGVV